MSSAELAIVRAVVEEHPDGYVLLTPVRDASGRLRELRCDVVNRAGREDPFGERLLGQGVIAVHPGLQSVAFLAGCDEVLRTGQPSSWPILPLDDPCGVGPVVADVHVYGAGDALALTWRPAARAADELALRDQEALYRRAFDAAPVGKALVGAEGRCLRVNRTLAELAGSTPDALRGRRFEELVHPDDRHLYEAQRRTLVHEGHAEPVELRLTGDGRDRWVLLSVALSTPEAGQSWTQIVQALDIDRRREAELRLARSNADLEQFAYVASHDLQEPLRMVTGYLQLLNRRYRGQLNEDAQEFIGYAVDGAQRMSQLISDLLSFSRVARHERPLEPCALDQVVDEVLANLAVAIAENGTVRVESDGELPVVIGDPAQLVQVLQNLVGNGLKFHQASQPAQVVLRVRPVEGEVEIAVADNGIGIEPRFQADIFQPFRRLHTRAEYPGTGMGLAIADRIVHRHGGDLSVESAPGQGSTFRFRLPLAPAEARA